MTRSSLFVLGLIIASASTSARADSGQVNLHADFGVGGALVGPGSYQNEGDERSVGGALGLGLDWQFLPPFALEALFHVGGFTKPFPTSDRTGSSLVGFSAGMRFRLLDNTTGYLGEPRGDWRGNLYASAHVGFYSFDSSQYGFDFTVGYEFSVHRPFSIGPMVRLLTLMGGRNDGADVILVAGIGTSVEVMARPSTGDTDGDGILDETERRNGTDPLSRDTDGDGLSDRLELDSDTDPLVADTDGDGLSDGYEDQNANGLLDVEETDPRNIDTDGGGISDGDEVLVLHTDPRDPIDDDSDRDGVPNDADACANTPAGSAVDHAGCPTQQRRVEVHAIAFIPGRSRVSPEGEAELTLLARTLAEGRTTIRVLVLRTGNAAEDAALATRRAEVIATWLSGHDVGRERFTLEPVGGDEVEGRTTDANTATLEVVRD